MSNPGFLLQYPALENGIQPQDSADFVIVGTGAAGATAGRVLTEMGFEVILLEEGPFVTTETFQHDVYTGCKRVWRDMGAQAAMGKSLIPVLQGRCVGGSTTINCAIIHRMPEPIHQIWQRDFGLGDALHYRDLEAAWEQIEKELRIEETPADVLGLNNQLMGVGAAALGITSNPIRRNVAGCVGSARCLQGCPTGNKQSMNVSYIPRAIAAGARVYATCQAERILSRHGRSTGVQARFYDPLTGKKGPAFTAHARQAVLVAASAIQTPLLLKASGIGRRSGLVGKRFQAHPGAALLGVFEQPIKMWFGATQGYESTHFWHERIKFETISLPLELGGARLPGVGAELMQQLSEYGHIAQWAVQIRAHAHGTVRRGFDGKAAIYYGPNAEDVRLFKKGLKILVQMMFAAGARQVIPGLYGLPDMISRPDEIEAIDSFPDDPRWFHCIATHLFGTATMGPDPASSVVGPDCQSHELPGLYVIDSSCFPTNLGVNPQHTIMGIAWQACQQLGERLSG